MGDLNALKTNKVSMCLIFQSGGDFDSNKTPAACIIDCYEKWSNLGKGSFHHSITDKGLF